MKVHGFSRAQLAEKVSFATVLEERSFSWAVQVFYFLSFLADFSPRGICSFDFFSSLGTTLVVSRSVVPHLANFEYGILGLTKKLFRVR